MIEVKWGWLINLDGFHLVSGFRFLVGLAWARCSTDFNSIFHLCPSKVKDNYIQIVSHLLFERASGYSSSFFFGSHSRHNFYLTMQFLSLNSLVSLTFFLVQATYINSLPWDSSQSIDETTNSDTTPSSLIAATSPEWTLFNPESSVDQSAMKFDRLPPVQDDGDFGTLLDPYLLQDQDSYKMGFADDLNAGHNHEDLTTDSIFPNSIGDTPVVAADTTSLRYDIWNFFPWVCSWKLHMQASCCTGSEDDNSVRYGCGIVALNKNCDVLSNRYCCDALDRRVDQRTFCVRPPPDGENSSPENVWRGGRGRLFMPSIPVRLEAERIKKKESSIFTNQDLHMDFTWIFSQLYKDTNQLS